MRVWQGLWLGLLVAGGLAGCDRPIAEAGSPSEVSASERPSTVSDVQYRVETLPTADVHWVMVPIRTFEVVPAIADGLQPLSQFAQQPGTVAAINAGFFDPVNGLTTSYGVQNGQLVADPRQNDRLMQNPNLAPYLSKILNRSEFRRYRCGELGRELNHYAIARHADAMPPGCTLQDAIGGGPRLLPEQTLEAEGFADPATGRDALGSTQPNARSAVGILPNGDIVLVLVAQRPDAPTTSGLSLEALAEFLQSLGMVDALNLDGGSSASLYVGGNTVFGRVDAQDNPVQRPVKSVLRVRPISHH
ncbi:MAG: phosphodiester glycosidase family protein [Cyanobacteriota bacterium]